MTAEQIRAMTYAKHAQDVATLPPPVATFGDYLPAPPELPAAPTGEDIGRGVAAQLVETLSRPVAAVAAVAATVWVGRRWWRR